MSETLDYPRTFQEHFSKYNSVCHGCFRHCGPAEQNTTSEHVRANLTSEHARANLTKHYWRSLPRISQRPWQRYFRAGPWTLMVFAIFWAIKFLNSHTNETRAMTQYVPRSRVGWGVRSVSIPDFAEASADLRRRRSANIYVQKSRLVIPARRPQTYVLCEP